MLVSYHPRGSVAKIWLHGYVQYEIHMVISILVRIIQRYIGPMEDTKKNLGSKYQNWVKLKNTGPSNRDRALLDLLTRFRVRFPE